MIQITKLQVLEKVSYKDRISFFVGFDNVTLIDTRNELLELRDTINNKLLYINCFNAIDEILEGRHLEEVNLE